MRKLIYFLILAVIIGSILYKARVIKLKEQKEIVSIAREWSEHGKPVDVTKVARGNIYYIEKVSGVLGKKGIIEGEIPAEVADKLKPDQRFTAEKNDEKISGYITYISKQRDILTGLHKVKLRISSKNKFPVKTIIVAKVKIKELKNVLRIPESAVAIDNSHSFCWVVKDNIVVKKIIKQGVSYGGYIQVKEGLSNNDLVCINGLNKLEEEDRVMIRKEEFRQ